MAVKRLRFAAIAASAAALIAGAPVRAEPDRAAEPHGAGVRSWLRTPKAGSGRCVQQL